jgi:hypothetical protein
VRGSREDALVLRFVPALRGRVFSRLGAVSLGVASVALMGLSSDARADEAPSRPEKHESDSMPPPSVRLPTFLGGLAFTTGWWGLSAGSSYLWPDSPGFKDLRTPVIGPWRAIAHNGCDPDCDFPHYFQYFYFALSGIAQAGGIGIMLESLLVPTSRGGERPRPSVPPPTLGPTPEDGPAPDRGTPPPSTPGGPLFFLPQPIRIGQSGYGIGIGGLF